jgi:thermostable 8-oxoguanine DNA glycosylase
VSVITITFSAILQSLREQRQRTKSEVETTFKLLVSAWKESTKDQVHPTRTKELTFCIILPSDISVYSKIRYDLYLTRSDKTILHPFDTD